MKSFDLRRRCNDCHSQWIRRLSRVLTWWFLGVGRSLNTTLLPHITYFFYTDFIFQVTLNRLHASWSRWIQIYYWRGSHLFSFGVTMYKKGKVELLLSLVSESRSHSNGNITLVSAPTSSSDLHGHLFDVLLFNTNISYILFFITIPLTINIEINGFQMRG